MKQRLKWAVVLRGLAGLTATTAWATGPLTPVVSPAQAAHMRLPPSGARAESAGARRGVLGQRAFPQQLAVNQQQGNETGVKHRGGRFVTVLTPYLRARIALRYPGLESLSVDSLGKEHFHWLKLGTPPKPWPPVNAERGDNAVGYRRPDAPGSEPPRWAIAIHTNEILLQSRWVADDPPAPLVLETFNRECHATLLGLVNPDGSIRLPAILHFPGQGSFRISVRPGERASLGYHTTAGKGGHVAITFPAATRQAPARNYRLRVVAIYPHLPGIAGDPRFDAFRRDWLNIFQVSPQWRCLANNASSDTCAFCYYEYADVALHTPRLATGLTALDLVRQTLDRIFAGGKAYGMPGHGAFPVFASDTLPSLLIAAEDYVDGSGDRAWLATHYDQLQAWTKQMLSTDRNGDGLIEYALSGNSGSWPAQLRHRPSNWWDCIGFGHEDAYANALAYRALRGMTTLARESDHSKDERRYRTAADRLKATYFKTFYDPATGVLAGWRSADGRLHDYYFPWVNGIAIDYGLVPGRQADEIMNHLLAKMQAVGYTNFALGLPGNLIPVAKADYVDPRHRFGGGTKPDGSDGFQLYENGGATACFSCFTLAALYDLGRVKAADRMLFSMLTSFDHENFQGWGADGMSRDWKTWNGKPWGYEGFLSDNYYTLLAVLNREAALKRNREATGR